MPYADPQKRKDRQRQYYLDNQKGRLEFLEYHRLYKRRWRKTEAAKRQKKRILEFKQALKEGVCTDCKKTFAPVAMEFDHLPGANKSFKVSQNSYRAQPIVMAEVAKCELVCVLCHRDRTHARYRLSDSVTARKKRALRAKVDELKKRPCEICGVQYDPWKMDFDHLDPSTKYEKISDMVRRRASFASILNEILKCRLLCALCHRLWTQEQVDVAR